MKLTLAYDRDRKQFYSNVGKRLLYLGSDASAAQARKLQIVELFRRAGGWTADSKQFADRIRKGLPIEIRHHGGESASNFREREERVLRSLPSDVAVTTAVTDEDIAVVERKILEEEVARLEKIIQEALGKGAVVGASVTIHAAMSEFFEFRQTTQIDIETGKPSEYAYTERSSGKLVMRLIEDIPLSKLTYNELHKWCKAVANRPLALKSGTPITQETVKNALKVIRRFCEWCNVEYAWRLPENWRRATKVLTPRTREERRAAIAKIANHYTVEEIGLLWKFANTTDRMLLLLCMNFGVAQAEIRDMEVGDLAGEKLERIRGKSQVFGRWWIWPETRKLAETHFHLIPKKRSKIAEKFNLLVDRVGHYHPGFKRLSFKWLRKTGSSVIRKISRSSDIATLYLSHGVRGKDNLLEVYAADEWERLDEALVQFREMLLPHLQGDVQTERILVSHHKLKEIKNLWGAGLRSGEIVRRTGVSRATVYRHKPN